MGELKRYKFWEIFHENPGGTLTPIKTIRVGPATFGSSVTFGPGVSFGGVNFFDFKGNDIQAEEDNDVLIIKGFYRP